MSAWGITNFENEIALAFVNDLALNRSEFSIETYIDSFKGKFHPEKTSLDECLEFFAVVELLAALLGEPAEDLPSELKDWIEGKYIKIEESLVKKAIAGINDLVKDSEAKEMYLDGPYFNAWLRTQKNLIKRLSKK